MMSAQGFSSEWKAVIGDALAHAALRSEGKTPPIERNEQVEHAVELLAYRGSWNPDWVRQKVSEHVRRFVDDGNHYSLSERGFFWLAEPSTGRDNGMQDVRAMLTELGYKGSPLEVARMIRETARLTEVREEAQWSSFELHQPCIPDYVINVWDKLGQETRNDYIQVQGKHAATGCEDKPHERLEDYLTREEWFEEWEAAKSIERTERRQYLDDLGEIHGDAVRSANVVETSQQQHLSQDNGMSL